MIWDIYKVIKKTCEDEALPTNDVSTWPHSCPRCRSLCRAPSHFLVREFPLTALVWSFAPWSDPPFTSIDNGNIYSTKRSWQIETLGKEK